MGDFKDKDHFTSMLQYVLTMKDELPWLEFKHNNDTPEMIGKLISALSNGAAMQDKASGYIFWGIADNTREMVGTTFNYNKAKKGNQPLEIWLNSKIGKDIFIEFSAHDLDGRNIVGLKIQAAFGSPTKFDDVPYIRVGETTPRLTDFDNFESRLWTKLLSKNFEDGAATENCSLPKVVALLDLEAFYRLYRKNRPSKGAEIAKDLLDRGLIMPSEIGNWSITNLGAALFAKDLNEFPSLSRKTVRLSAYGGISRDAPKIEPLITAGYAAGFEGLIQQIHFLSGANEVVGEAYLETILKYPDVAIRELTANLLIHQDFTLRGTGPQITIFTNRIEFSNPGQPLVDVTRILDSAPVSRNEKLAKRMREMKICEEEGTGVDKVVIQTEVYNLPAPLFEVSGQNMVVKIFSRKPFDAMNIEEKVRACYFHTVLKYIQNDYCTNTTLRERFGLQSDMTTQISRLLREALIRNLIKPYDPQAGNRAMKYVPFFA